MRPLIIPIFIPHEGCPHRCVFCEQHKITDRQIQPMGPAHVEAILRRAVASPRFDIRRNPEVAFYGGTFTGLPIEKMQRLIGAVSPFVKEGLIRSMRISTRPDALDEERLGLLKTHGVHTVELGVQSMNDDVLSRSRRGHTAQDSIRAVEILKEEGFRVGIQLMPGLPGDSPANFMKTVETVLSLKPDMVRLYPTVVIQGTELARQYLKGTYQPLTLEDAVAVCRDAAIRFEAKDIPVIRLGLQASPSLTEKNEILAGPWHPAFGFLVRSAMYHSRIAPLLPHYGAAARIRLFVSERDVPLIRGYKNKGICLIEKITGAEVVEVLPDERLPGKRIEVEWL